MLRSHPAFPANGIVFVILAKFPVFFSVPNFQRILLRKVSEIAKRKLRAHAKTSVRIGANLKSAVHPNPSFFAEKGTSG